MTSGGVAWITSYTYRVYEEIGLDMKFTCRRNVKLQYFTIRFRGSSYHYILRKFYEGLRTSWTVQKPQTSEKLQYQSYNSDDHSSAAFNRCPNDTNRRRLVLLSHHHLYHVVLTKCLTPFSADWLARSAHAISRHLCRTPTLIRRIMGKSRAALNRQRSRYPSFLLLRRLKGWLKVNWYAQKGL